MRNKIHEGKTLKVTAPSGGYTSGQAVLIGASFGVSRTQAAEGEKAVLDLEGCFRLTKATGASTGAAAGARAYWDDTAKKITAVETDNMEVGIFNATAADGADACEITLGVRTVPGATS